MRKNSSKNLSLLGLILILASAAAAAAISNKTNGKRTNNGTLRAFSATAVGGDQDAAALEISCRQRSGSAFSCTATIPTATTTGSMFFDSVVTIRFFYYQTIGNTSQTNPNDGINQNSTLQVVE